jgi:hypothetical protein
MGVGSHQLVWKLAFKLNKLVGEYIKVLNVVLTNQGTMDTTQVLQPTGLIMINL